ncbi:MAG: hypothetical protein M3220_04250 [Chloroflexota bacterium]|nr:hypothetical protein [Chloroflexota bacterium]
MKVSPTIVYVGDTEQHKALQSAIEAHGWYLLQATEALEALAFYVVYYPDLFILAHEIDSAIAEDVYFHLNTVHTPPLVILTDEPDKPTWRDASTTTTRLLSTTTPIEVVMAEVSALLRQSNHSYPHSRY